MRIKHQTVRDFALWLETNSLPEKKEPESQETIKRYAECVDGFADCFDESDEPELGLEHALSEDVQNYLSYVQMVERKEYAETLIYFDAIKAYYTYLMKTDERISKNITDEVPLDFEIGAKWPGFRHRERLTIERAFAIPQKNTALARERQIRDKAIVFCMMYIGLRLSETASLTLDNVKIARTAEESKVRVIDKNGEENRIAEMPPQARVAILKWLELRKNMSTTHNYLFVQANKNRQPLGKRSIEDIVKQTGYRVKMELTPQILRYTAIGFWRESMGDGFAASQLGISFETMWRYPCIGY